MTPDRPSIIAEWGEVLPYLEMLKTTIERDIKPLLNSVGYAPFTISREVMSYIDHLSHLYTGDADNVGSRFGIYLTQIHSKVDANYGKRQNEIYHMYRNGPIHEFDPKILENKKGQLLSWFCYNDSRLAEIETKAPSMKLKVKHLEPVNPSGDAKTYFLPVSTPCLIEDLICSINQFALAGPEDERITAWNRAAGSLDRPKPNNFVVP